MGRHHTRPRSRDHEPTTNIPRKHSSPNRRRPAHIPTPTSRHRRNPKLLRTHNGATQSRREYHHNIPQPQQRQRHNSHRIRTKRVSRPRRIQHPRTTRLQPRRHTDTRRTKPRTTRPLPTQQRPILRTHHLRRRRPRHR